MEFMPTPCQCLGPTPLSWRGTIITYIFVLSQVTKTNWAGLNKYEFDYFTHLSALTGRLRLARRHCNTLTLKRYRLYWFIVSCITYSVVYIDWRWAGGCAVTLVRLLNNIVYKTESSGRNIRKYVYKFECKHDCTLFKHVISSLASILHFMYLYIILSWKPSRYDLVFKTGIMDYCIFCSGFDFDILFFSFNSLVSECVFS